MPSRHRSTGPTSGKWHETLPAKPYKAPDEKLPGNLADIDYDHYRAIRFLPERALWRGEKLAIRGAVLPSRLLLQEPGRHLRGEERPGGTDRLSARAVFIRRYRPAGPAVDLGFAGFRLHAPINKPDYYDEVCVFLGASYFRAVAKGQLYGLSARGLSINTGEAKGEEFPFFKTFWIEKPAPGANSIVVHALLDSESAAAAYRFTIRPGDTTVFDVEMAIYPRVDLDHAGLAPMTSMFFFGPNDRKDVEDFRPSVHDSDGLAIFNGRGEELWRPLHNPSGSASLFVCRSQPAGLRPDAASEGFCRLPGPGIEFRAPAEPVGGADRRLGRRRGEAARDSNQRRDSRQHRLILASQRSACPPRASTPTPIDCTGDRMRRSRPRWRDFPEPASAREATTPRSSCST